MENQSVADKLIQLEKMLQEQQEMLREQRTELASLRQTLAQKQANRPALSVTTNSPAPVQLKPADPSRRKMLKRMGLAVLAGGAALGVTAATYSPAEAKLSVNPSSNIGAVITRNGKTITNIPTNHNYGLIGGADDSFDAMSALNTPDGDIGVSGFASTDNFATGIFGYSANGYGVYALSNSGYGAYALSVNGTGVAGESIGGTGVAGYAFTATSPAIVAKNAGSTSGIALQLEQGGLTVKGAGVGTGVAASTNTAAFIHKTTSGVGANIPNGSDYSIIDNPLCNNRPDALLFVTPNLTPNGASGIPENKSVAVFYSSGYWNIYHEDTSAMPAGVYFNVLIINP